VRKRGAILFEGFKALRRGEGVFLLSEEKLLSQRVNEGPLKERRIPLGLERKEKTSKKRFWGEPSIRRGGVIRKGEEKS